ncbi:CopG family transcriptional regulator [Luteitalea sp. TBR-22]|uniref:ribbon-helix-helix domain-containing protein n=1 Tax=Luteitalea sp. TBR-22 TaxID=2802971 RepID=UPI001EF3E5D5|nr:CopG family transcriptional regulator [Luteitalea sp. TBR-22]
MRTTLDIEDDVLAAVKALARKEGLTAGEMLSLLARRALTSPPAELGDIRDRPVVFGFRPFPPGKTLVTNEVIDDLRDRDGV